MSKVLVQITFFLFFFVYKNDGIQHTRFKSVNCIVSNPTLVAIPLCKIKVYSRSLSSLNLNITLLQPIKQFFVRIRQLFNDFNVFVANIHNI